MKQWTHEVEIDAPIEKIWNLLNGSLENMQKIMPNVVENTPIKITDEGVGSVYRQKYKEGNRVEEYEVETIEYLDSSTYKKLKVGFTLANMFDITAFYELIHINDEKTLFKYTVTNRPLKWFVKFLLLLSNKKVVVEFSDRVKQIAESEA
ncbi:SRPBCC family protein [Bacillus sp. DTU_2020_1000418_1_SI_GHA_SEK_038]|uniref:SRPBCC family protein n=1 Tax=Bacillus sp. DTU_2020_1000418_1_SI_GHA_SEK_038 TaxID=3077585 RepID=UPI0028EEC910|nr:SRPBCC family protein [Bacillus sp. DTU_2020_1000418_1_SI_GHA_SEK_038]WNS73552.1 SRPBCC family protein [Bacillus sp. DTU_2020_1000418_1_SI_GHA_SEK_038]